MSDYQSGLLIPLLLWSVSPYPSLDMAIPPRLSFVLLILVSAILLSCDGTQLSRTKRTVELIEGAKDFILRCNSNFLFLIDVIVFILIPGRLESDRQQSGWLK